MKTIDVFCVLLCLLSGGVRAEVSMPHEADYSSMWWAEGFPSVVSGAAWHRCIQTGYFAMMQDTESLDIRHLGPLSTGKSYLQSVSSGGPDWTGIPSAKLDLEVTVEGTVYRAVAGGAHSRFKGPRLIAAGRYVQRADVTDVVFESASGQRLDAEGRFETVAWPDRLSLILAVRPGRDASSGKSRAAWTSGSMRIGLNSALGQLERQQDIVPGQADWSEVALCMNPVNFIPAAADRTLEITAAEVRTGRPRSVAYEPGFGWHRVDLNGIDPIVPHRDSNDAMERVKLVLKNSGDTESVARLLFEKSGHGFRHRTGSSITGVSTVLRDADGNPTGRPVQLSKNWHRHDEGGVYSGTWFHGFSMVRVPPGETLELELSLVYGHWGGVAAASHAQLSLIGWGSNQRWDESALGAWGESICYEPEQVQRRNSIMDVRPLMVDGMKSGRPWTWTTNVGGGDYFRLYDAAGNQVIHSAMQAAYSRYGPCLTEVTYAGKVGAGITHSATVSLARTDDVVRGTYRLRLDVSAPTEFSRLALFQVGSDTYNSTAEKKLAWGNEHGVAKEWDATWSGDTYRTQPIECTGEMPWVSLHDAVSSEGDATANRGFMIRAWSARLGGKEAMPWIAERGLKSTSSIIDVVPPPGTRQLEPGDFVEATIEHVVVPQFARHYYGPNEALRLALTKSENTSAMIQREARGNHRRIEKGSSGAVTRLYPDVCVRVEDDVAEYTLHGGLGYIPLTFDNLSRAHGYVLTVNDMPIDQSVHGNDFWQCDYDAAIRRWSQTYNIPASGDGASPLKIRFAPAR
jgi:hypothetical protein